MDVEWRRVVGGSLMNVAQGSYLGKVAGEVLQATLLGVSGSPDPPSLTQNAGASILF